MLKMSDDELFGSVPMGVQNCPRFLGLIKLFVMLFSSKYLSAPFWRFKFPEIYLRVFMFIIFSTKMPILLIKSY